MSVMTATIMRGTDGLAAKRENKCLRRRVANKLWYRTYMLDIHCGAAHCRKKRNETH